jgi:hypothetical protein
MTKKTTNSPMKCPTYRVRFWDIAWEEHTHMMREGSMGMVLQEIAIWTRSRETDNKDQDSIAHTVLRNLTYVSVEVIDDGEKEKRHTSKE